MTSEQTCFVYIVLPNTTEFVTAARFRVLQTRDGMNVGELVYGKKYLARPDVVEIDPVELRLGQKYETARMNGFFGAIRDAMPDYWGRKVIEHAYRISRRGNLISSCARFLLSNEEAENIVDSMS